MFKRVVATIATLTLIWSHSMTASARVLPEIKFIPRAETYLSQEVQDACDKYAEEYGISRFVLYALVESESSGRQYVTNASGTCKGLAQVNDTIHADRMERLGVTDIYDIDGNIHVAVDYLMELADASDYGDISYVLDRYNGNSKADYYQENGILSPYAEKVLDRAYKLESWYDLQTNGVG